MRTRISVKKEIRMLKIQHLYLAVVFVCTSAVFITAQECGLKPEQAPVVPSRSRAR